MARALLGMYNATGDPKYLDSVEYWLRGAGSGRWYYNERPGVRVYLDEARPHALGYILLALAHAPHTSSADAAWAAAPRLWNLVTPGYWMPASDHSCETNVETQSSTALGLHDLLGAMLSRVGVGVEYVRGGILSGLAVAGSHAIEGPGAPG